MGSLIFATNLLYGDSNAPGGPTIPPCTKRATKITYVNGVWNTSIGEVQTSVVALKEALTKAGINTPVSYIYSPFSGYASDAVQSAAYQAYGQSSLQFIDSVTAAAAASEGLPPPPSLLDYGAASFRSTIDPIKEQMLESISERRPRVFVCHSRGNLACNAAYRELADAHVVGLENIGIVGVAVPDTRPPPGHYDYITFKSDSIIGSIPGALPPNFGQYDSGQNGAKPGAAHDFVDTYLQTQYTSSIGGAVISENIQAKLIGMIAKMQQAVEAETFPCDGTVL